MSVWPLQIPPGPSHPPTGPEPKSDQKLSEEQETLENITNYQIILELLPHIFLSQGPASHPWTLDAVVAREEKSLSVFFSVLSLDPGLGVWEEFRPKVDTRWLVVERDHFGWVFSGVIGFAFVISEPFSPLARDTFFMSHVWFLVLTMEWFPGGRSVTVQWVFWFGELGKLGWLPN